MTTRYDIEKLGRELAIFAEEVQLRIDMATARRWGVPSALVRAYLLMDDAEREAVHRLAFGL
jgi:hypothetical protein